MSRRALRQSERERRGEVAPEPQPTSAEPLLYMTRSRPQIPRYDGPSFRQGDITPEDTIPRPTDARKQAEEKFAAGESAEPVSAPAAQPEPPSETLDEFGEPGLYRLRDFSPEARRSRASSYASSETPPESRDLDYATQSRFAPTSDADVQPSDRRGARQGGERPESTSAAVAPKPADTLTEYTMTRRELRALQAAEEAEAAAAAAVEMPEAINSIMNSGPIILPPADAPDAWGAWGDAEPETPAADVPEAGPEAEPEAEADVADESPFLAPEPVEEPEAAEDHEFQNPFDALLDEEADALAEVQSEGPEWEVIDTPPVLIEPSPFAEPAPLTGPSFVAAMAEFDALTTVRPEDVEVEVEIIDDETEAEAASHVSPASIADVFHWANPQTDEETDVGGISRGVSDRSGAVTANALVMPNLPAGDVGQAVSGTGEILITGSMDLPRGLGSTGGNPDQFDTSDIDHLLDAGDREHASTDSAPVRAVRAISTHTGTQGMVSTKKSSGNRTLTILVVSASVMAVGVVGLFIAGMLFGIF